ncbi:MAG TPA: hypothetical protein VEF36_06890 [Roseiarcus sp.]|nr:hypothetical protein [Roseiarcus sp.]
MPRERLLPLALALFGAAAGATSAVDASGRAWRVADASRIGDEPRGRLAIPGATCDCFFDMAADRIRKNALWRRCGGGLPTDERMGSSALVATGSTQAEEFDAKQKSALQEA